ncbi:MAG: hypothetical protein GX330_01480 [Bacteroidales bacterium]|nr:hypothetical protein [Bacteroidales bacterium]
MKAKLHTKLLFLIWFTCQNSLIYSINYHPVVGARSASMAHASVALKDPFAVFNNPAMMAYSDKFSLNLHYENRFLLKETSTSYMGSVLPLEKGGVFGLHVLHFGHVNYGELNTGLSYAKAFGKAFSIGMRFDYLLSYFGEEIYGKSNGFTFEVGMYGQLSQSLGIGFVVYNPARLKMNTYNDVNEYIPTIIRLGLVYNISEKCLLTSEIEKDMSYTPTFRLGVEYEINEHLFLRMGLSFPDFEYAFGVGWNIKSLKIDFSSNYHTVLGYSPQLSLNYTIK